MASVIQDPGGGKRIQWCVGKGQRRTLRLGNVSKRQADAVRVRIEQVLASRSTGVLDAEAARWLETVDDALHEKLARLGLVARREVLKPSLGALLDAYFKTLHVKPGTRRTYAQTRASLEDYFGTARSLADITALDCDLWRQKMREEGLAAATIAKRIKTARQIFKQGIRWKMMQENPLADVKAGSSTNRERMRFISLDDVNRLLDACPDAEWRLIIVLSRFAGLRCPSEVLPLTWADVDFANGLLHVKSCKTEGYAGKDRRTVPMFPEVRKALMDVFEQADEGTEFVIARHRLGGGNYRTQMLRIIERAGLQAWPKPFHNMRSSRQTELSAKFPMQSVCAWLGNSAAVAMAHYLQVLPEHVASAVAWTTTGTTAAAAPAPSVPAPAATGATRRTAGATGNGAEAPGRHSGQRGANDANVAA